EHSLLGFLPRSARRLRLRLRLGLLCIRLRLCGGPRLGRLRLRGLLGVPRLLALRRVLGLLLGGGRVGRVRDGGRSRLDLRLDRRLLASLRGRRRLVRPRTFDVVLSRCAVARSGPAAAAALTAAAPRAAATSTLRAHGAEIGPVALSVAAALARRAETFRSTAAPASRLILLAEPHVLVRFEAAVALGHDLALVDPDLDADAAEGELRLDEPVVDVRANRVQRYTPFGVGLGAAHLRS